MSQAAARPAPGKGWRLFLALLRREGRGAAAAAGVPETAEIWAAADRLAAAGLIPLRRARLLALRAAASARRQVANYRLARFLGAGSSSVVWRARQQGLERVVALKLMPLWGAQAAARDFFRRGARAAARLNHANIVRLLDAGEDNEFAFLALEYVPGRSLERLLAERGPLPEEFVLSVARQAACALAYVEECRIVHRDLKPANLLLADNGAVKLADLGLCREVGCLAGEPALGTPHYLSPEQARHREDLDGRSDLYSLGATLYHLLAGEPPFAGRTAAEVIRRRLEEPPPDCRCRRPEVGRPLAELLQRLMATRPEDRPAGAGALLAELDRLAARRRCWRPRLAAGLGRLFGRRRSGGRGRRLS